MTTPSETAPTLAAVERRLHPLSWLFLLLQQLRQFALPLVALLVFGRGGGQWWEAIGAIGAVLIALNAVLQYLTYRFRIAGGELTIRSGLLHRNVRHIPLQRIQNVALRRNLLHRLAGVAEVRLESAAGSGHAEAQMRVLSLADAAALEALVRAARDVPAGPVAAAPAPPLVALPLGELVRLGLASNRGMVLVAAAAGALSQAQPGGFGRRLHAGGEAAMALFRSLQPDSHWLVGVLVLAAAALVLLRLLSVAMVVLRLHGFVLHDDGERLSVEAGLLTRHRGHAARHKVQRWLLQDNLWLRLMQRRTLRVETAAVRRANDGDSLTELVPILRGARLDRLFGRWLPALRWPVTDWQPLHPAAWRRFALLPSALTLLAVPVVVLQHGALGLAGLLLLPLWLLRARRLAAFSGWACDGRHLVWRTGWLARQWHVVEIARVQLLRVEQSPFDRRRGMASLLVDTAGAHPGHPPLRLRHLPEQVAHALSAELVAIPGPGTQHSAS
jgi:putative membrane protein